MREMTQNHHTLLTIAQKITRVYSSLFEYEERENTPLTQPMEAPATPKSAAAQLDEEEQEMGEETEDGTDSFGA